MLKTKPVLAYGLAILFCLSMGMISGLLTQGEFQWYHELKRPLFTPPDWIFQPVWTLLYIIKGIILATLFIRQAPGWIWALFTSQFILNLLWTPLFFHFHLIGLALVDITFLCIIIGILMWIKRRDPFLFYLFLPYELWLIFALILNIGFFILNP